MNFDEEPNDGNVFYYTGIEGGIKRNVTVVHVKSRVRVIRDGAFNNCTGLRTIFFNERLDSIGVSAVPVAIYYNPSIYPATSG
jgi:hypothetical protein